MTDSLLDALESALRAEREALAGENVEALLRSTEAKLQALRAAESAALSGADAPRVAALAAFNRENGLLLARRRRAVAFALRQLGRSEAVGYDRAGQHSAGMPSRTIAVA
ncbi:MAG TPA: flagellar protein FlgN [Xanthomonadaceae bacterium]|jgi:hypothetical protein|nr:flagellar protein FlgN [Xanthomonadaceae bacterium]